jgi:hypothetical protein
MLNIIYFGVEMKNTKINLIILSFALASGDLMANNTHEAPQYNLDQINKNKKVLARRGGGGGGRREDVGERRDLNQNTNRNVDRHVEDRNLERNLENQQLNQVPEQVDVVVPDQNQSDSQTQSPTQNTTIQNQGTMIITPDSNVNVPQNKYRKSQ